MKRHVSILFFLTGFCSANAQPGSLDNTFGTGGKVSTSVGTNDIATAIVLQSDGKILVAGNGDVGVDNDFIVMRYNTDGTLDNSFDFDGIACTFFEYQQFAQSIVIQNDEKILVAGYTVDGVNNDFALARYYRDGSIDFTFSSDGILVTNLIGNSDKAHAVIIQPDGKILVAGTKKNSGDAKEDFALVRYNLDGTIDSTFCTNGHTYIDFGTKDNGQSIIAQPDGKLIVAGYSTKTGEDDDILLARFTSDGIIDSTFDLDGKVRTDIAGLDDRAYSVALQTDGKILLTGYTTVGAIQRFILIRYNSDGSLDTTFDHDGRVITAAGSGYEIGNKVLQQTDGKIIVVGFGAIGSSKDFIVIRYNVDGSLDNSFDGDGIVSTNFAGFSDEAYAALLQADGKILVAGKNHNGSNFDIALARYNVNTIGITESKTENTARVFPNPSNGKINLSFEKSLTNASLKITNSTGQIILSQNNLNGNNFSFDVSQFVNGIYFIEINEGENISRIKFIKE